MPLSLLELSDAYPSGSSVEQNLHIDTLIYKDGLKKIGTYTTGGVNPKKNSYSKWCGRNRLCIYNKR